MLESFQDFLLCFSFQQLHREDGGEDENPAQQADQVVEEWCDGAQFHCSLRTLHVGSISEERT